MLKNKSVSFLVQPNEGYEVTDWEGIDSEFIAPNKLTAKVTADKDIEVTVKMRKIPDTRKLKITAKKIKNLDMKWSDSYPYTYFVFNLKAKHGNDLSSAEFQSLWHANNGEDLSYGVPKQTQKARKIYEGEQIISGKYEEKVFDDRPAAYHIQLDLQLIKFHDSTGTYVYRRKFLSKYGDSLVTISYDRDQDTWRLQPVADKDKDNVVIEFPKSFVLKRGESKDFTIKYIGSDSGQAAVGTAEVTYTLKWE